MDNITQSQAESNIVRKTNSQEYIYLSIIIIVGLIIRVFVSWQDFATLFQKCVVDDALFYLNISKHIAEGKGATFDGFILTNGFHPVYALILVPLFWLFPNNPDLTFHLALTICSIFNVLTGVVIHFTTKNIAGRNAGLIASFLWIFNPYVILISLNGVEVSVACFFLSLCIYKFVKMRKIDSYSSRDIILLGVLSATAILGRVDAVFLLMAITFFIFYAVYKKEEKIIPSIAQPALFCGVVFAVLAPWFYWNLYHFGTIRQISGVTLPNISHNMYLMKYKTYFSFAFILYELNYLKLWILSTLKYSGGVLFFCVLFAVFIFVGREHLIQNIRKLLAQMKYIDFAILSTGILVSFYSLYFWGWHRPWYYLSVMLVVTICTGIIMENILLHLTVSNSAGPMNKKRDATLYLALLFYFSLQGNQIWMKGLFPFQKQLYESAVWMNENTEKDATIGAISSGSYGYFTHRAIDLLGVVNNEAYRAIKAKKIFAYMKKKNIKYLVDREDMIRFFSERFDENGFMGKMLPIKKFGDKDSDIVVYRIIY